VTVLDYFDHKVGKCKLCDNSSDRYLREGDFSRNLLGYFKVVICFKVTGIFKEIIKV